MIRSSITALSILSLLLAGTSLWAQDPEPLDLGTVEKETVRLVLIDVMVLNKAGIPVPGLTIDDFEIFAGGKPREVDTLDVACSDPRLEVKAETPDEPAFDDMPDGQQRIVLALDYLHLTQNQRVDVIERAKKMIKKGEVQGEIMLAALNGGLRVEQQFTSDAEQVLRSLHRMEYDISLWEPSYVHLNEFGFVDGMSTLLDVLGEVPGTKAIVLFSGMQDVPLDTQFAEMAALAAASRCFVYPVDAVGLRTYDSGAFAPGGG